MRALALLAILVACVSADSAGYLVGSTLELSQCFNPGELIPYTVDVENFKNNQGQGNGLDFTATITYGAKKYDPEAALAPSTNTCSASPIVQHLTPNTQISCGVSWTFPDDGSTKVRVETSTVLTGDVQLTAPINRDYWIVPNISASVVNPPCNQGTTQVKFTVVGAPTYTDANGKVRQEYAYTVTRTVGTWSRTGTTNTNQEVTVDLEPGTFSYTIHVVSTDGAFACVADKTVDVINPTKVVVTAEGSCDAQNKEVVTVKTATGGTGSYTYSLSSSGPWQPELVFNVGQPGTYTVWAKDGNNCLGSTTVTVRCIVSCALTHGYWRNLGNKYVSRLPSLTDSPVATWCGMDYQYWLTIQGNNLNENAGRQYTTFVLTMWFYAPNVDVRTLSEAQIVTLGVNPDVAAAVAALTAIDKEGQCGTKDKAWYEAKGSTIDQFNNGYFGNPECSPKLPRNPPPAKRIESSARATLRSRAK